MSDRMEYGEEGRIRGCCMSVPHGRIVLRLEIPFHYHDMKEDIVDSFSNGKIRTCNTLCIRFLEF